LVTILLPIFFYHNTAQSLPRLGLGRVVTCRNINRFKFEIIDVFAMRLLEYDKMALGIFRVILPQKH
ncbi:MAG TPA: hypothetical protein VIQ31_14930, partial [Phormidium sp.]